MSMFGIDLGTLLSMGVGTPPKQPRPAPPPPPMPSFLPPQQQQQPPQRNVQQPPQQRQVPPTATTSQSQKPRNGAQQAAERNNPREAAQEKAVEAHRLTAFVPVFERGQSDGRQEEQGGSTPAEPVAPVGLDCDMLAEDMTQQADEGIFELILPDGKKLGVAVRLDATRAQFLLSPSDEALAALLKQGKMELEGRLARRMNKDVDISLL